MSVYRGRYIQRGQGIGSILSSLWKTVYPAVKSLLTGLSRSPITKKVIKAAKKSAIDAGLNIAADTLSGENVGASIKKNAGVMGVDVLDQLKSKPAKKRKNAKRKIVTPPTKLVKKTTIKRKKKMVQTEGDDIFDEYP